MRTVLAAALLALSASACASEHHDPTPAELEQLCVDTGDCLVAECSDEVASIDALRDAPPAAFAECVMACAGSLACEDSCEDLPEAVEWREAIDEAEAHRLDCEQGCSPDSVNVYAFGDLGTSDCHLDPEDHATSECAVETAVKYFRADTDIAASCADWVARAFAD